MPSTRVTKAAGQRSSRLVLFRERTESGESCIYSTRTHQPGQLGMRPVDSCRSNHRRSFTGPMPNTHLGLRALVPATFSKHRKARIYLLGQPPAALQHQNGFLGPHSLSVASRASSGPKAWNGCVGPHQITKFPTARTRTRLDSFPKSPEASDSLPPNLFPLWLFFPSFPAPPASLLNF